MSDPSTTVVFCTNFGATLYLHAKDTDNCSENHYANAYILHVIYSCISVECDMLDDSNNNITKTQIVSRCGRWISFIDTISKGKK